MLKKNRDLTVCTEHGEVTLDAGLRGAINQVEKAAGVLGLSASEFIFLFESGFPECPCCESEQHVSDVEYELALGYDKDMSRFN